MNDRFESLEELLSKAMTQARINYYAYAMGRSRTEQPTQNTIRLAIQLIYSQGPKWIEVLERFAVNNYDLVYEICKDCPIVYPTLINIAHPVANQPMVDQMQIKIFQILDNAPSDVNWCAFTELIRYRCEDEKIESKNQKMIALLNRINSSIGHNRIFVESIDNIQDSNTEQSLTSIYSITPFKVLLSIVKFYKTCCTFFRNKMAYLQTSVVYRDLIAWMRAKYTIIFNNFVQQISRRQQISTHFKEDILECLRELKNFVELQPLAITASDQIVTLILAWSVVPDMQNDAENQLNWEYGLIYKQYGDDLPSYVAMTTTYLASSIPGFLKTYLSRLTRQQMPAGEVLMRLAIVHEDVNKRRDLIEQLLEPFFADLVNNMQPYTEDLQAKLSYCRQLRLFLLYCEVLKESYFKKLISEALAMIRRQNYASFCFEEGFNILKQVNSQSNKGKDHLDRCAILAKENTAEIINSLLNITLNVYQQYPLSHQSEEREGKLNKILTLLEKFIFSNQQITQKFNSHIIKYFCEWTTQQAIENWRRGIRSTSVLNLLIRMTKLCITFMKEDYYYDLERSIYDLLELIKDHRSRDYDDELLQILTFVINFEQKINPELCMILISLERMVESSKSLYCIMGVIKAICQTNVAASILYEWPQLCLLFFNLFTNYINYVGTEYRDYYPREWQQIIILFGRFIQVYESYLDDNEDKRRNLLLVLQGMKSDELQMQLFIAMDHHRTVAPYRFFHPSIIPKLTRRNSFKLLYIHYCDRLLRNYEESAMNQLIQLHHIQMEKRTQRTFINEIEACWPCLETQTKTYLLQTLQELKRRGKIDGMEHSMFRRELDLQY